MRMTNQNLVNVFFCIGVLSVLLSACAPGVKKESENTLTDNSLADIKSRGKLIVGTFPALEPMVFKDTNGEISGYDSDLAKEIASNLGVEVEFKEIAFPELINSLSKDDIDVIICAMTITPERSEKVLFSVPYINAGQTIITRKETVDINTPVEIKNKKVGVQKDTTCEKFAKQYVDALYIVSYESFDQNAIEDLKKGKLDAIVIDYVGAVSIVKNNPELRVIDKQFTEEYYGIATKLGNDALMEEVNRILRDMKRTGKLDEIKKKWLN
ncbi:MAG: ABC transporter substrate-binding protein [archaeon]